MWFKKKLFLCLKKKRLKASCARCGFTYSVLTQSLGLRSVDLICVSVCAGSPLLTTV